MRLALLLGLGLFLLPLPGRAAPCDQHSYGLPTGPVAAGLLEGELGRAHRACGRSELAVDAGGLLVVDLDNFYGRLAAGLRLEGSWAWGPRGELFGSLEVLRYDSLITPLSSSSLGLGHTTVGAAYRFADSDRVALGLNGKLVLPTAVPLYRNTWPVGIDFGVSGQFEVHRRVQFHAQVGLLHSFGIGKGPTQPRLGASLTAGTELRPAPKFAVAIDLLGRFGYTAPLDVFGAALALRFSDGRRFGFELGGTVPILGRERALARVDLKFSVRLGPIGAAVQPAPAPPAAGNPWSAGGG